MSAVKVKNKPVPNKTHVASATGVTTSNDGDYNGSTEKITYVTGATLTDALTDAVDPLEKPPEDKKKLKLNTGQVTRYMTTLLTLGKLVFIIIPYQSQTNRETKLK